MPPHNFNNIAAQAIRARRAADQRRTEVSVSRKPPRAERLVHYRQRFDAQVAGRHQVFESEPPDQPRHHPTNQPRRVERPNARFLADAKLPALKPGDSALEDIRDAKVRAERERLYHQATQNRKQEQARRQQARRQQARHQQQARAAEEARTARRPATRQRPTVSQRTSAAIAGQAAALQQILADQQAAATAHRAAIAQQAATIQQTAPLQHAAVTNTQQTAPLPQTPLQRFATTHQTTPFQQIAPFQHAASSERTAQQIAAIHQAAASQHLAQQVAQHAASLEPSHRPDPDFVITNGRLSRKRHADTTEIELVAALHDLNITDSGAAISRGGPALPDHPTLT
ncbi:hypothetical protein TOPH_02595 [Tolypocladium ophioglossoides CBS 100239]|uniref:Uncharacterized protein n=1 Tax=Tolypocladium ophioglossoides (strain CBS 100239) TaxID=1163406 RepID=A0A0L0NF49_TOLOC|nr:hypothetical protein TOPH_02595 [Tolypocladium ophioglossoides CBS 100239]